jgi:O-antigen ligase
MSVDVRDARRVPPASPGDREDRRHAARTSPPNRLRVRRATAFLLTGGVVAFLAFSGGGYDLVVRQELGLVVWSLVAVGVALGVLPRGRGDRALIVPLAALAALWVWLLLSFAWTESDERTSTELARLTTYAGLVLLPLLALNRATFKAAAAGASVAAVTVCAVAVGSRLFPDAFPEATNLARRLHVDRLTYPFDYWNAVGAWGGMTLAICLAWSAHARLALTRSLALAAVPLAGACVYLSYSRGGVVGSATAVVVILALSRNRWTSFAHVLVGAVGAAIVILTIRGHPQIADATGDAGSGAVLGALVLAALGCGAVAYLTRAVGSDRVRLSRQTANWAVPAFVGVVLVGGLIGGHGVISRAWDEFTGNEQSAREADPAARLTTAGGTRSNLWDSALDTFSNDPFGGSGAGTFEFTWSRNPRGNNPEFVRDAHSLYIEQLSETGLPGFLLLTGFLGGALAVALRVRRSLRTDSDLGANVAMTGAFCVFLVSAGVDWMWEQTAVGALALGGIAIAAAGGSRRLRRPSGKRPGSGSPHRASGHAGLRVALVSLAVLAAAVEVPGLVSTQLVRASKAAARDGDLSGARELAQQAGDAQPWAASPHEQLALVYEQQGRLRLAQDEIREAISDEQTNWRYPLLLARIQVELGNRPAARRTFVDGKRLRPLSLFYTPFGPFGRQVYTDRQLLAIAIRDERKQKAERDADR